jgi:hypothetical protein
MPSFFKTLARGAERGVGSYYEQRDIQRQQEEQRARREQEQERYEQARVESRIRLGLQMAMDSGDPNAVVRATQEAIDADILGKGIDIPDAPMPIGEHDPRMVIEGTETIVEAPDPFADFDPTAQDAGRAAAKRIIRGDQDRAFQMESQEAERAAWEREELKAGGWQQLHAGVLWRNGPDGKPQFNKDGQQKVVKSFDKDTGIIIFTDGSDTLASREVLERMDEVRRAELADKVALEGAKNELRAVRVSEKFLQRVSLQNQAQLARSFKVVNEGLINGDINLEKALSDLELSLHGNQHAAEFVEAAKVALGQTTNKFRIEMSNTQQEELVSLRSSMTSADELLAMLDNPEVAKLIGPINGRWNETLASISGNKNLSGTQIAFLTKLMRVRDNTQRGQSGAALTESEQQFYRLMVGDTINTAESLRATLSTLIEVANTDIKSFYIQGFLRRDGKTPSQELVEELERVMLYRAKNVKTNYGMDLKDDFFDEDG